MYGFRVVLKDTFAPGDLDTVINQLVFRSQGDLEQFVDNRDLFVRVVGEIMTEFNMQQCSNHLRHMLPMRQECLDWKMQMAITSGYASFGGESMLDPKTESSGGTMTCKGCKVCV